MATSGRGGSVKVWVVGVALLAVAAGGFAVVRFWPRKPADPTPDDKEAWFEDVTDRVGLNFTRRPGDPEAFWQPDIHGSGVAIFDYDGDKRLDLFLLDFGPPGSGAGCRLFKNMPDGTFKDVTAGSGLGIDGFNTGVAAGDVNNDGWPDLVVTQHRGIRLFLNKGDGTFRDATEGSGLVNPNWGTSVSFLDYDQDGFLDLVVVNYLNDFANQRCYNPRNQRDYCGPRHFEGTVSKLFHNLGPTAAGVTFKDVTIESGLAKAAGPGLAVYCADFTGDGRPDVLIVNDNAANHLWVNQGGGKFAEEAFTRGIALDSMGQAQAGMGAAVGDVDGDGLFDVYMTHLNTERNTLWVQGPKRGYFQDKTADAGLLNSDWRATGFGTLMADFDQDGWPDLAVANGGVMMGGTTPNPAFGEHLQRYTERNQLFRNEGRGKFRDVSRLNPAFCGNPTVARSLAAGDLDGDGAVDLVVTTVGDKARVYRNVARSRGHWLIVRAVDPRLKRDAYGAELRLQVGDRTLLRIVNPSDSYQCSSDPRGHFGLGGADKFDAIHVLWPDGLSEVFPGGPADRVIEPRRGEGIPELPARKQ